MGSQLRNDLTIAGLRDKWPRKDARLQLNLLPAFEAGDFHDCTIRVGCNLKNPKSSFKDFKCHKLILSACSPMFETMFFSHFKEATMGPDEPILMDKIDPEVFENAMRFVYGQVKDFKTTAFGAELYRFASEMQIETLTEELTEFFKQTKTSEIFFLFDLYCMSANKMGLDYCKLILEVETKEAIESRDWLNISAESVLEFLDMECLNINEAVLVWALIRWGKFQLKQQNGGGENLRSKILPGLRKIRFNSLTQHEVAKLCSKELGEVLTGDEKSSIFMSIITGNWEKMPTDFVSPSKLTPRHAPYTFISLPYQEDPLRGSGNARQTAIRFHINKSATVIGVKLNSNAFGHDSLSSITLGTILDYNWTVIGTGDPEATSLHRGEKFYRINSTKSLVEYKECYLMFKFAQPICERDGNLKMYTLSKEKHQSNSGVLALTILDVKLSSFAHVLGIVFDNVRSP